MGVEEGGGNNAQPCEYQYADWPFSQALPVTLTQEANVCLSAGGTSAR